MSFRILNNGNVIEEAREGVKFARIDAEVADSLKADGDKTELPAVAELFKKIAGERTTVEFERFRDESTPALLNIPEEMRRVNDMMKLYRMGGDMPLDQTLMINTASPLIAKLARMLDENRDDDASALAKQIYLLASLSQRQLTADELIEFVSGSYDLLNKIGG